MWRPTGSTPGISAPTSGGTQPGTVSPRADAPSGGFGPQNLQSIYGITSTPAATAPAGSGPLVAVIEAHHYPQMASDLAAYRSYYGLPACTEDATDSAAGCLREIDETGSAILPGSPSTELSGDDWSAETSLDLDMISAVCPSCRLLVVGVSDDSNDSAGLNTGLNAGIAQAVAQGAKYVSMSFSADTSYYSAKFFTQWPHVLFTAAVGDRGYQGAFWPAEATGVVSVGGVSDNAGALSVWNNGGATNAGCAVPDENGYTPPMPAAQQAYPGPATTCGVGSKAESDVSAIADPDTGVAVYTEGQWYEDGGTSVASPIIAALFATAGNNDNPGAVYNNATASPSLYSDVTSGSICPNGTTPSRICQAQAGWDGPTGVGMPTSPRAVAASLATLSTLGVDSTTTVPADGIGYHTVTATAYDATGAPEQGVTVHFTVASGATLSAASAVTNAQGVATTQVTSTTVGSYTVTASATDATGTVVPLTPTSVSAVFTTPVASPYTSTVSVDSATVPADGTSTHTVTVTVKDANGVALPGQTVSLSGAPSVKVSAFTDWGNGVYTATLTSTTAGLYVLNASVTVNGTPITVGAAAVVVFQAVASANASSVTVDSASVPANGTSTHTVTITVKDTNGVGLPGQTVTLSVPAGVTASAVTDQGNGVYTATLTSTTAGSYQVSASVTGGGTTTQLGSTTATFSAVPATNILSSVVNSVFSLLGSLLHLFF